MSRNSNVKMLAEGGIMIALSILLSYIPVYQAPNGGSVTAGSMIPLMLFAIRWGVKPGIVVGSTYGILHFILKPYFYHWAQFILDYPLAYGLLGLAGICNIVDGEELNEYLKLVLGIVLAIGGRMLSHVLSGVIFFAESAGAKNPWLFSIGYNATYLIPELIISIVVLVLIWKPLKKVIES
ncbi:MAG: energy-coupled thiamine transporter ThiT [Tissierellaceae bacterium]